MIRTTLATLCALLIAAPAAAGVTTLGGPACLSRELLDDLVSAVHSDDQPRVRYLVATQRCLRLPEGLTARIVETHMWAGVVEISITLPSGAAVRLFTPIEFISHD